MMRTNTDLLDTIARRLGVPLPDLRDWCPLLSLQALLEVDNRIFPVEEWNRALAFSRRGMEPGAGLPFRQTLRLFLCL